MSVIAAGELHDSIALGRCARDANRRHRRFGSRRDETHLLDRRHRGDDAFRELDLDRGRCTEAQAARCRIGHRAKNVGMRVSRDQRTPLAHDVDVAIVIGIPQIRALRAIHEAGIASHGFPGPNRAVYATGDDVDRACCEF